MVLGAAPLQEETREKLNPRSGAESDQKEKE